MACIHYKFKNSLDFDSITFDGLHISVRDLKMAIMQRKKLNDTDMDLLIINALNAKAYKDEEEMIPKNASVIVARIPLSDAPRSKGPKTLNAYPKEDIKPQPQVQMPDPKVNKDNLSEVADLVTAEGSEEDKIKAMMKQSTKDFDPSNYQKRLPTGTPSPSYVCFKCNRTGHFIHNCPNAAVSTESGSGSPKTTEIDNIRMKRPTGIPHTFLTVTSKEQQGAMSLGDGRFAVPTIDQAAFKKGKKERPPFLPSPKEETSIEVTEVPTELTCLLCKDLITDAVVIPCCGNSYCDECIRNYLLEDEDHKCPTCGEENVSPDKLIINKSLRVSVNNFKNETLYQKKEKTKKSPSPPPPPPTKKAVSSAGLKVDTNIKTIDLTKDADPEPETPVLDEKSQDEVGKGIAVLSGRKPVVTEENKIITTTSSISRSMDSDKSIDSKPAASIENYTPPQAPIPSLGPAYRPQVQPVFPNIAVPPPGYRPILYPNLLPVPHPTVPPAFIPPQVAKPLSEHEFYREKKRLMGKANPLDDYTRPYSEKEPRKKSKSLSPKRRTKSPRSKSRSRTPLSPRKKKSYSRSPKKRSYTKSRSRSRSPFRKKKSYSRSRSRSITPRRRSRTPRRSFTPRSRSRSWTPKKFRGRSRSFTRSRTRSRSRTPRLRRRSFSRTPPRRRSFSRSLTPRRRSFSRSPPRRRSRSPFYRGRPRSPGYYGRDYSPPPYRGSGYRSPPPRGYSPTRYGGPGGYGYGGRDYPSRFDPRMYEELFQDYISRYGLPPPPPPSGQTDRGTYFDPQKGVYRGGTRSRSRSPRSNRRGNRNRNRKDKDKNDKQYKTKDKDKKPDKSKSKGKKEEEKPKDKIEKSTKPKEKESEKDKENKSKKPEEKTETVAEKSTEESEKKPLTKKTVKKVVKLKDGTIVRKESLALRLKTKGTAVKSPVKGKVDPAKKTHEIDDKVSAINRSGALKTIATVGDVQSLSSKESLHNRKRPGSNLIEINTQVVLSEVKDKPVKKVSPVKNKEKSVTDEVPDKKLRNEVKKQEINMELKVEGQENDKMSSPVNMKEDKDNTKEVSNNEKTVDTEVREKQKVTTQERSSVPSPTKKVKVIKKVKKVKKLEVDASQSDSASDLEKVKTRKKKRVQEVNDNDNSAEESPAKRVKQDTDNEIEMRENKDDDQLMLSPPALSKWEREDYEDDKSPDLRDKLKNRAEKKPLPKSVIESAEKAITQKQPKPAVASAIVPAKTQKKVSVHDRLQKSPVRQSDDKNQKSPVRHNRRVYMDEVQDKTSREEDENRRVRSRENSMQITVSSDKTKGDRDTERNQRKTSESDKSEKRRPSECDWSDKRKVLTDEKSEKYSKAREKDSEKLNKSSDVKSKDNRKEERAPNKEKSEELKNGQEEKQNDTAKKRKYERKESIIDEALFVPDYNEHSDSEEGTDNEGSSASQAEEEEKSDKDEKKHKKHKKEKKKKNKKHKHKHKKKKHKKHKEENTAAENDD